MEVSAEDGAAGAAAYALEAVAAVVAVALEHAAERLRAGPQVRAPAVVLEAREHPRAAAEVDLDRDVADQARAWVAHGLEVDEPDAGQPLAAELVGVAEQLVAAADREDDAPALGCGVQRVALDGREILRAQLLVTVLTTPEVEEVVGVGIDLVAEARA